MDTPSIVGGEEMRASAGIDAAGGMLPRTDGGATLPRTEGGATLPRTEGGATLAFAELAGGIWLRPCCDWGEGVATGGGPDGGGMVGRKARRAMRGSYSFESPKG
jgi:hypothetical protein